MAMTFISEKSCPDSISLAARFELDHSRILSIASVCHEQCLIRTAHGGPIVYVISGHKQYDYIALLSIVATVHASVASISPERRWPVIVVYA